MVVDVKKAIEIVNNGGIVIFPTDTAFGIGCRIDNKEAVEKLFQLRKRPSTMATPVLCSSVEMVKGYTQEVSHKVKENLMDTYWPGALTIILPSISNRIPSLIRGGKETVGVRIPNHPVALELIKGVGIPIVGTSANFHGNPTPYSVEDLDPQLVNLVDGVLEGVCTLKKESTVIDCTQEPWKILRQGAVTIDAA